MREFFLENSQIAVLISSSKFIKTVSHYAQIPDKQNYLKEVGGIMKL